MLKRLARADRTEYGFQTDLSCTQRIDGEGNIWRIDQELRFLSHICGLIRVPVGFITDFASVPRYIPIISAMLIGQANASATVHDYLYRKNPSTDVPRIWADQIFLEAMEFEKVGAIQRVLLYQGARAFGWMHYQKIEQDDIALRARYRQGRLAYA